MPIPSAKPRLQPPGTDPAYCIDSAGELSPRLDLEASCLPYSWALHGVHLDAAALGGGRGKLQGNCVAPHPASPRSQWEAARIEAALGVAISMRAELGRARVWIWSPRGIPGSQEVALLIGSAALSGVSACRLGIEVPAETLWTLSTADHDRLTALQNAGLQTAVRIVPGLGDRTCGRSRPLAGANEGGLAVPSGAIAALAAHANSLRMIVIAAGVLDRTAALELGSSGVTAVRGPVVSAPMGVEQMRRFLGPCEQWLEKMRADSL